MTVKELLKHQLLLRKKFAEFAEPNLRLYNQQGWFTMDQNDEEIERCCDKITEINPHCILELGCGRAGTHVLFKGLAETVISVDHSQGWLVGNAFLIKEFYGSLEGSYFVWGDGRKQSTANKVRELMSSLGYDSVDVLFVDMHWNNPDLAKQQFQMYKDFVRPGGFIFVHQWHNDLEVRKFLEGYAAENNKNITGIVAPKGFTPGLACIVM